MQKINILWLREEFRLDDNQALFQISNSDLKFNIIYCYNQKKFEFRSAQRWWLFKSLKYLEEKLSARAWEPRGASAG